MTKHRRILPAIFLSTLVVSALMTFTVPRTTASAIAASKTTCTPLERKSLEVAQINVRQLRSAVDAAGAVLNESRTRYAAAQSAYQTSRANLSALKRAAASIRANIREISKTTNRSALKSAIAGLRRTQTRILTVSANTESASRSLGVLLADTRTSESTFRYATQRLNQALSALARLRKLCGADPAPTPSPTPTNTIPAVDSAWNGEFCKKYRDYYQVFQEHLELENGDTGITTEDRYTLDAIVAISVMSLYPQNAEQSDWTDYAGQFYTAVYDGNPVTWSGGLPTDYGIDWYSLGWTNNADYTPIEPYLELVNRQQKLSRCLR